MQSLFSLTEWKISKLQGRPREGNIVMLLERQRQNDQRIAIDAMPLWLGGVG
jgi:hypothetical protein